MRSPIASSVAAALLFSFAQVPEARADQAQAPAGAVEPRANGSEAPAPAAEAPATPEPAASSEAPPVAAEPPAVVAEPPPVAVEPPSRDVRDLPSRFGVLPTVGFGFAKIGGPGVLPGFIGLSTLGIEVHGEVPPYGGFVRFQFDSSGLDGRWTAPSFALGVTYRFIGDGVETLGIVGRAGLLYERWHGMSVNSNCPIDLFVPSNCKALVPPVPSGNVTPPPPVYTYTGDNLGLLAGVRLELPVQLFYLAVDGELGGLVEVGDSTPGTVVHLRFALVAAFRDVKKGDSAPVAPPERRRRRGL
jgi:hypothetical protein